MDVAVGESSVHLFGCFGGVYPFIKILLIYTHKIYELATLCQYFYYATVDVHHFFLRLLTRGALYLTQKMTL